MSSGTCASSLAAAEPERRTGSAVEPERRLFSVNMSGSSGLRRFWYSLHGLSLASNMRLATVPVDESCQAPVLELEFAEPATPPPLDPSSVAYRLTPPGRATAFITVSAKGGGYLVRIDGCGDFTVDGKGDRITCAPVPGCPLATVEQILVDQVIPHVMQLRGRPCLHASAVAFEGRAAGFLGPAGSGKSTITAALCQQAATLVTDDCLALIPHDDFVYAYPGYPSVRLWSDSAHAVFHERSTFPTASPRTPKLRVAGRPAQGSLVLVSLFLLEPSEQSDTVEAVRLAGSAAFSALASSVHRLVDDNPKILEDELALLSQIGAQVPIFRLTFPRRFESLDKVVALVVRVLATLEG